MWSKGMDDFISMAETEVVAGCAQGCGQLKKSHGALFHPQVYLGVLEWSLE